MTWSVTTHTWSPGGPFLPLSPEEPGSPCMWHTTRWVLSCEVIRDHVIVMWCHERTCDLMRSHERSCDVMWDHVTSCGVIDHVMSWENVMSWGHENMWCHVMSWENVIWGHERSCDVMLGHVRNQNYHVTRGARGTGEFRTLRKERFPSWIHKAIFSAKPVPHTSSSQPVLETLALVEKRHIWTWGRKRSTHSNIWCCANIAHGDR